MKSKTQSWNYEFAKQRMKDKGLSKEYVAEQLGMRKTSLTQNLNGRKPSLQAIKLWSQVLGCNEEDLLNPSAKGKVAS